MLLPSIKNLIAVAAVLLLFDGQHATAFAVQSDDVSKESKQPYYGRPDFRAASLNEKQNRKDLVQQSYQEMLAQTQSRISESKKAKDYVYPGSYQISTKQDRYVRRELPQRLIPPGRNETYEASPYSLRPINPENTIAPAADTPGYQLSRQMQDKVSHKDRQHAQPVHKQSSQPREVQRNPATLSPANTLPPIVRPEDVLIPTQTMRPMTLQTGPRYQTATPFYDPRMHALKFASAQSASIIPAEFDVPIPEITRARILLTQQGGDLDNDATSEQTQNGNQPDLQSNQQEQRSRNPFADTPEDMDQQKPNPFADPPTDLDPQDPNDPFGQDPQRMPDVDPSPRNPGDIQPSEQFDIPDDAPDRATGETDLVPEDPQLDLPPGRAGPYKSRNGFQPNPILPAPPSREFDSYGPPIHSRPHVAYDNYGYGHQYQDQPSFFGSEFQKEDLYQGVNVAPASYNETEVCCDTSACQPGLVWPRFLGQVSNVGSRLRGRISCAGQNLGQYAAYAGGYGSCCQTCPSTELFTNNCASDCGVVYGAVEESYAPTACCTDLGCGGFGDACYEPMFYVALFGGYTQLENDPIGSQFPGTPEPVDILQGSDGYGIGMAIGQIQGANLRSEIEFAFRDNQAAVDQFFNNGTLFAAGNAEGSVRSYAGMFNLVWDFAYRPLFRRFRPYAGGGVGFAFFDVDFDPAEFPLVSGNESSFAYQWMAGFSRAMNCNTDWFIEYRYFAADDIRVSGLSIDYDTDNIFFGFRKQF